MSRTVRGWWAFAMVVLAMAGILALTRESWLRWLGYRLIDSQAPCKAELIVVLAGDLTGSRMLYAEKLVREGWAPKILVSGAGTEYGENEGDLAIRFMVRRGFGAGDFHNLPSPARSTYEEAQYVVPELRREGIHRFILLTSNYHTRRAATIYRKAGPEIPFCVVGAPYADFDPENWWKSREGQKLVFLEWTKAVTRVFGL